MIIKDRLQRLIKQIENANWADCDRLYMARRANEIINELQKRSVYGVDRFVQKLLDRVNDKEEYLDILTEGRFAIILARLKFSKIQIEYCERGPDIIANWNSNLVYFEVTRRRPSEKDAEHPFVRSVLPNKIENLIDKIRGKLKQLQNGEINVVVIWSDTINWLPSDMEAVFANIKEEIEHNPGTYNDLSAILFTEGEESYRITLKKFYLFKTVAPSKPLGIRLTKKLKSLHKQNLKKMEI